jgi:HK97 family phage prohead protease
MSLDAQALERMLACEAVAVVRLDAATKDAIVLVKDATSFDGALATLGAAISARVIEICRTVRDEAAKQFAVETGVAVAASNTDDSASGAKAAAWYAKAWAKAIGELPGEWRSVIEAARAACEPVLARIAAYEVCRTWNDEHRVNAATAKTEKAFAQRWATLHDTDVCKACKKMDGTYANDKGKFPGDVDFPPLHVMCRCLVITEVKAAPEGEVCMSLISQKTVSQQVLDRAKQGLVVRDANAPLIEAPTGGLLTRAFEVKSFDITKRTADFVASTGVIDAHDEIVDQGTWVLDDYLKNPVVLFAHCSRELPIGKTIDLQLVNGPRGAQLECRVEFCPEDMNPLAEQVWKMVVGKFLRAVSVGFIPRSYRYEMRDGVEVWVWADCVLKEISVTPVPANPEALAKMKGLVLGANLTDRLRGKAASPTHPAPTATAGGSTPVTVLKKKENVMTEVEILALQAAHEKSLLNVAEAKLAATNAIHELSVAKTQAVAHEAQVKTLTTERDAAVAQTVTLATDRDTQAKRAVDAEEKLVELEVEAHVGVKILPAEKADFVELRKTNPALFSKMIEQRSTLKLGTAVLAGNGDEAGNAKALMTGTDDVIAEATKLGASA